MIKSTPDSFGALALSLKSTELQRTQRCQGLRTLCCCPQDIPLGSALLTCSVAPFQTRVLYNPGEFGSQQIMRTLNSLVLSIQLCCGPLFMGTLLKRMAARWPELHMKCSVFHIFLVWSHNSWHFFNGVEPLDGPRVWILRTGLSW